MAEAKRIRYPVLSLVTPKGRLVECNRGWPAMTDVGFNGKKLDDPQFYFALAVPKGSRALDGKTIEEQMTLLEAHAYQSSVNLPTAQQRIEMYRIGSPSPAIQGQKPPYAWKISDGDSSDRCGREGQAGCWIFKFKSIFDIKFANASNGHLDIGAVKMGQYGRVAFNIEINGLQDDQAGVFLNVTCCRVEEDGPLIVGGPSAEQLFGAALVPATMPGAALPPAGGLSAPPFSAPITAPAALASVGTPVSAANPPQPSTISPTVGTVEQLSAQIAAQYGQQHHPGWRYNPTTNAYEADPTPPPPLAVAPAVPVGAIASPALSTPQPGFPATASPTNGLSSSNPPLGVTPHVGFVGGPK